MNYSFSLVFVGFTLLACGAGANETSADNSPQATASIADDLCRRHCAESEAVMCKESLRPFAEGFLVAFDKCKEPACLNSASAGLKRGPEATAAVSRFCGACPSSACEATFFGDDGAGHALAHASDAEIARIVNKCFDDYHAKSPSLFCAATFGVCASIENPDLKLAVLTSCRKP
jgi:hypothetical protein